MPFGMLFIISYLSLIVTMSHTIFEIYYHLYPQKMLEVKIFQITNYNQVL